MYKSWNTYSPNYEIWPNGTFKNFSIFDPFAPKKSKIEKKFFTNKRTYIYLCF